MFKRVDWDAAKHVELEAPWIPDINQSYHNCNERAQVTSRGALSDRGGDISKFVFLEDNPYAVGEVTSDGIVSVPPAL